MGTGSKMKIPVINPYVGPRPFTREDASFFFGRDTEARDLLSLVVSEQLVLFYAQSGAGKSSLINTRLVPDLEQRNFEVLPIARVSGEVLKHEQCDNIFAFNIFIHLDQSKSVPERFAQLRLPDFLANLANVDEKFLYTDPAAENAGPEQQAEMDISSLKPRVLIIDQFEEIVTNHPEAWKKRADLFSQITEAMEQDPYLWVVLVMREDYVATLDPFAHLLPNQMRARFYMRRMEYDAALEAVRKPVEKLRPFDTNIAEMLVDNLRLVTESVSEDGKSSPVYGEFIEPVQLQVVCYQLWQSLMKESDTLAPGKRITLADINALAKGESLASFINKALGDFYEQALSKVLEKLPGVTSERDMRNWFSTQLITEAETRGFVYQGKTHSAELPNIAVNALASYYIIRPETRPGGIWFELVHDRFVNPILQSNRAWLAKNQSRLLTDAKNWVEAGKPPSMLYEGNLLDTGLAEIEKKGSAVTDLEKEFIAESGRTYRRQREARLRLTIAGMVVLFVVLASLSWWAFSSRNAALSALDNAQAANQTAESARDAAVTAQSIISSQNATAQFQTTALVQQANNQRDSINRLQSQIDTLLAVPGGTVEVNPTSEILIPVTGGGDGPPTSEFSTPTPEETVPPTAISTATEAWQRTSVIGQSYSGKDIVVHQFGTGARHIILVGGLHAGYSPSTVLVAQRMIEQLRRYTDKLSSSVTIDVILDANPDSISTGDDLTSMIRGRNNANGVELNSNWDCNWRQNTTWSSSKVPVNGGDTAFSEPETRALKKFILSNLTSVVVVWEAHESWGRRVLPGGCGEISVFSQSYSEDFANASGYLSDKFIPYGDSGAMIDWIDSQGIPAITVYLPDLTNVSVDDLNSQIQGLNALMGSFTKSAK